MKARIYLTLAIIFSAMLLNKTYAQQEKYYAAFIYQFTNYVNWPNQSSVFVIGVIGNSTVTEHLQLLAKEKKIQGSSIVVSVWNSLDEVGACNVLFVPENQKGNISAIISRMSSKPVLVITESSGLTKNGAGISFLKKDGKIQFDLNKTSMKRCGLEVSSTLERLAASVL